ncbi:hypothetical protein PC9H_010677 [Pleurotus ostreatus]|uniref:Uncharacterized protein n=2 Tax=Pleurotus TaxID=5320 RepID=A0A8H6ZMX1_PLEOS|nr:uncharacterized protein PC9H_010677 [Pleurotus ostreatus]KAF7422521.1 hypothetical protein PC9H_010677 [Pleurotus ostreatus]KAG9227607.1 hypothetical protein CCMSSC00406_0000747 [Pleurotus cornucopiae]
MSSRISSPSTSTLQSTAPSVSSTAPLRASASRTQKDYYAAFGSLQSTYGMCVGQSGQLASSSAPAPTPRTKPSSQSSPLGHPSIPSSTMPQSHSTTKKDYSAAFGSLQSTYGMGVGQIRQLSTSSVPAPEKSLQSSSLGRQSTSSSPAESTQKASSPQPTNRKDYEVAFGALSSSQGVTQQPSLQSGNWSL